MRDVIDAVLQFVLLAVIVGGSIQIYKVWPRTKAVSVEVPCESLNWMNSDKGTITPPCVQNNTFHNNQVHCFMEVK